MERCLPASPDHPGNPLDTAPDCAQVSNQQLEKIESYVEIGKQEATGPHWGNVATVDETLRRYYFEPT